MAGPTGFFGGGSGGSLGALAAGVAIPAARFGVPLAAAAPAAGVALGVASAVIAGAAAAYYLRQYLNSRTVPMAGTGWYNMDAALYGWVLQCGSGGGQYRSGDYWVGCPITGSGTLANTGIDARGIPTYQPWASAWYVGEYDCAPPPAPQVGDFPYQLTTIYHRAHWMFPAPAGSEMPQVPWAWARPYSQDNPPLQIEAESVMDSLKAGDTSVLDSVQFPVDLVPQRDAVAAAIPTTSQATRRGYAEPTGNVAVPGYRADAYSWNPGLSFAWEYAPSRGRGADIPAIPAPPLVRPVPGLAGVPVVSNPTRTQETSWPAANASAGTVTVVEGVVVAPLQPFRPFPAPPEKRVKERKVKMSITGQASGLPGGSGALRLFNMATEFCDAVDALWDAIPFETKLKRGFVKRVPKSARFAQERKPMKGVDTFDKDGGRKFSKPGCLKKASQVNEAWKEIHLPTAVKNLIQNEITDRAIGTLAQKATKAHAKAQRSIPGRGSHSPLLGPTL